MKNQSPSVRTYVTGVSKKTYRPSSSRLRTKTKIAIMSVVALAAIMLPQLLHTTPPQANAADMHQLEIWWPTNGAHLSGTAPFKIMLQNASVDSYTAYWQVDNGKLNEMPTSLDGYPHKESLITFDGWTWNGNGPYAITFTAKNSSGEIIGKTMTTIYTGGQSNTSTPSPTPAPAPTSSPAPATPAPAPTTAPTPAVPIVAQFIQPVPSTVPRSSSVLNNAKLYVNPYSEPQQQANAWRASRPADAAQLDKIASGAESQWFGNWNSNVKDAVSNNVTTITNSGAVPVMVAYNIPQRDCGGYSAGGVGSPDAYRTWIRDFADGIGDRNAAVILEPDATSLVGCLSPQDQQTRFTLISDAVKILKAKKNVSVYIDAGHPGWVSVSDMVDRLKKSGISEADGFALNVANFSTNSENIAYGTAISNQVNGKHFVIDTGRNGSGQAPDLAWCNPSGRTLGVKPTTNTGNALVDAFLWVKGPAGSDGNCNGGPNAGVFWAERALDIARHS